MVLISTKEPDSKLSPVGNVFKISIRLLGPIWTIIEAVTAEAVVVEVVEEADAGLAAAVEAVVAEAEAAAAACFASSSSFALSKSGSGSGFTAAAAT